MEERNLRKVMVGKVVSDKMDKTEHPKMSNFPNKK